MSKALVGVLALAAVGGLAFVASKANAATGAVDLEDGENHIVQGDSGTTYGVRMTRFEDTPNGRTQTYVVSDAAGAMLTYVQFAGDNSSRMLQALEPNRTFDDAIVRNAIQDFGIFVTSFPG